MVEAALSADINNEAKKTRRLDVSNTK